MNDITIHFADGNKVEINKCDNKCVSALHKWIDSNNSKVFPVEIPKRNKTVLIRKELILFVEIV